MRFVLSSFYRSSQSLMIQQKRPRMIMVEAHRVDSSCLHANERLEKQKNGRGIFVSIILIPR
jgi:hypothetical protein